MQEFPANFNQTEITHLCLMVGSVEKKKTDYSNERLFVFLSFSVEVKLSANSSLRIIRIATVAKSFLSTFTFLSGETEKSVNRKRNK